MYSSASNPKWISISDPFSRVLRGYDFRYPNPTRKLPNPPDPTRKSFKPARPDPQSFKPARPDPQRFQTRPTRPAYSEICPNPTRLPAESMLQIILAILVSSLNSKPFFKIRSIFHLFFSRCMFFELERNHKYIRAQMSQLTNREDHN